MRPVGRGDRGKSVVDIQTRLAALGYFLGREGADGLFGPHTENAIRAFQQERLLSFDGVVEDNTWTELVEAVHEALSNVSDRQAEVFLLRHESDMSLEEIAKELRISVGAAKSHLHRALEALRERLKARRIL